MGDAANEKAPKAKEAKAPVVKSWFKGLKAEFKKIIWPDKETLTKQTIAVLLCSVAIGAVIAVLDLIIKFGLNIII